LGSMSNIPKKAIVSMQEVGSGGTRL
jgi:hypothetical protein